MRHDGVPFLERYTVHMADKRYYPITHFCRVKIVFINFREFFSFKIFYIFVIEVENAVKSANQRVEDGRIVALGDG